MPLTVTMQLNVGANEAGDWANRSAGSAGSATRERHLSAAQDEILIRLHGLRGAVEAMREEPHGVSLADTRTSRVSVGFGAPALYHGMCFMLPGSE